MKTTFRCLSSGILCFIIFSIASLDAAPNAEGPLGPGISAETPASPKDNEPLPLIIDSEPLQPVAVEAPREGIAGELVKLTAHVPPGAKHVWIYDPEYKFKTAIYQTSGKDRDTRTLVFATPHPGLYRFWSVYYKTEAERLYKATVVIKIVAGTGGPGDLPSTPPPPPTSDPLVEALKQLFDAVKGRAAELNDPPTAQALAASFTAVTPDITKAGDIKQCGTLLSDRFEAVMLARGPPSRDKDWENQFRRPLNDAIAQLVTMGLVKTPADYAAVVRIVTAALEAR